MQHTCAKLHSFVGALEAAESKVEMEKRNPIALSGFLASKVDL
jgi:hypothetical protein